MCTRLHVNRSWANKTRWICVLIRVPQIHLVSRIEYIRADSMCTHWRVNRSWADKIRWICSLMHVPLHMAQESHVAHTYTRMSCPIFMNVRIMSHIYTRHESHIRMNRKCHVTHFTNVMSHMMHTFINVWHDIRDSCHTFMNVCICRVCMHVVKRTYTWPTKVMSHMHMPDQRHVAHAYDSRTSCCTSICSCRT